MRVNGLNVRELILMFLPVAILQYPFYYSNEHDYLNYGSIGSVIGHELTHSFDNNGRLVDANGKENNWWTENDDKEFNEFSQCFIDQYSAFKINDQFVDGERTLDENIADNGGISRSYEAWKLTLEKNPKKASHQNKKLPGLSQFTFDQLFYISFAQHYCSIENDDAFRNPHSPAKARINLSLSNSKVFAEVFNCPTNSPMNPQNKCEIW
ncbi:hypothetical protein PIROE2DRAFT_39719 [Piromyces sp. E2]|nr:hypothetical protein PIROE2DRAFT_39719 [Piromyces sp. E2]|eukprot:OUM67795.1 hypothetical protein PIROE2DRAFT_39719 [Piromyces sp. E2]